MSNKISKENNGPCPGHHGRGQFRSQVRSYWIRGSQCNSGAGVSPNTSVSFSNSRSSSCSTFIRHPIIYSVSHSLDSYRHMNYSFYVNAECFKFPSLMKYDCMLTTFFGAYLSMEQSLKRILLHYDYRRM